MSKALHSTSSTVCRVELCTSLEGPQETLVQDRLWTKASLSTLARMQHFTRRPGGGPPQDPLWEIEYSGQQHPGPRSIWRCSFIPKTVLEPRRIPQEKVEQATRCEGTDSPGAHHQTVWWEGVFWGRAPKLQKHGSDNTGR